jgi:hypothetical protein
MQDRVSERGHRLGQIRSGSREFENLQGEVTERWIADSSGSEGSSAGKIELVSQFVGREEEL